MKNQFVESNKIGMTHGKAQRIFIALLSLIFLFGLQTSAHAQFGDIFGFGKNKVHYRTFEWSVINTEHFDVYFYEEERQAALDAAEVAERSYAYLSKTIDYKFKEKIPLLLYASHNDFQQTNAIQSYVGEGTQGVTESLKGRMILPITGSYGQFIHVLTHEMVHAFQFDIMLSDAASDVIRQFNPPLWFIEGMAEYLSVGMDNITRMWMRDAVLNNTLLDIPDMTYVFDIRVYRMGQAIWYYVGERYGKEVVGRIFKTARATGDIARAFKAHTGLGLKELSERWQKDARAKYLPREVVLQQPEEVARPLIDRCKECDTRLNIVPAISPDGKQIAYIGDKNFTLNMFLRELEVNEDSSGYKKTKLRKIVQSGSSQSYESLRYFTTSMNWSPDGRLFSFVAKAGQTDAIYIVDAGQNEVVQKLTFNSLTGMAAPSWSPNGDKMVFSGTQGGISDLYVVDASGENLQRLTDNRFAHLHPQWSPDGRYIAFTTDRGPNTKIDSLIFGEYNIATLEVETGEIKLITEVGGNHINPVWTKEGDELFFISDMNGIPNIYNVDLNSGELFQITNLITGVSGIITESPAITLARDTGRLAFSVFIDAGWYIYTLDEYKKTKVESPAAIAVLEELENPNLKYREYTKPDSAEFLVSGYKTKLTADILAGTTGFGTNNGYSGQAAFLFSDMLGDKNLLVQAMINGDPFESTIVATFYNQKHRLNWALSAFQFRNEFGFSTETDFGYVTSMYRGAGAGASLPLNPFFRIELNADLYHVSGDVALLGEGSTFSSNSLYTSLGGALVYDSARWGLAAPYSGSRTKVSMRQNIGDFNYRLYVADFRNYLPVRFLVSDPIPRISIALKTTAVIMQGRDARSFSLGGPDYFRGQDYGFLFGEKAVLQNMELRFPLLPFLSIQYDFLTGLLFFDAVNVWDETNVLNEGLSDFNFNKTLTAYGYGLRFNLGGLMVLRWDFPLKREKGAPNFFFSINVDY